MADPASNMVLRFLFIVAAICLSGIHAADIKIAYMAPFLRPQAFYQLQYAQHESVLRYYMDEINQSGTLSTSNYNFTLTYLRNDATTPAGRAEGSQSIINVLDLVQRQNVSAIIGEPFSYNTISSALVSSRFNIPQCSQSASTDDLSNKGSFGMFMRTTATNSGSGRLYVKYFIEKFGWKKFALAYSRDTFGASLVDGMQAAINEAGGTIAKQVFFTVSNNVSACDAVEQLKSTDARIFLCAALESDCMYLIGCAHRAGLVNPDNVWISGRELPLESDMLKPPYGPEFMSNFSNVFHLKRINGLPESPEYQTFLQKWDQMGRNPQIYNGTDQPMQSYSTAVYHCLRLFVRGFKTQLDEAVRTGPLRGRALEDAFLAGTLVPRLNLTMFNDTMTMGPKGPLTIDENGDGYDLVEVDSIYQGKASAIGFIDYSGKTSLTGTAKFFDGSAIIPPDRPPSEDVGLTWKDAGSIALAIITLLLVCITIVFVVFIVLNKNERIIKASSPLFLVVMAIGNLHVATAATLLTLPTIIILIAWTVLDATKPVLVTLTNVTHYYACAAPTRFPFNYIIVGYVGLLLMITSYLCYKVRSVPSNFNESRHLLFAVTITLICAIVAVVVREEAGKQYFLIISIHTTMILAANTVMVFATLGIKIFLLSQAHSRQNTNFRSGQYTISLMSKHTKLEDINLGGPAGHEMSGVGSDGKKNIGVARRQEVLASVQLNEGGGKGFMENWCDCTLHVSAYKPFVILFKKVVSDVKCN
ncbi:hypothetical protein HK097_010310 [Rhizophlyctis rosea]|uniref:G-protein coupled receptors family 3 profile domain-containing protein n=1 Tax=Rhizophlyctis rosea TaxID=64517 RepID=A0AAD5X0J4_9FUNG|nr:hypothetical protein HK097_010310 [Rhizophlyctis rosea]